MYPTRRMLISAARDIDAVTVRGMFLDAQGQPVTGKVMFLPQTSAVDSTPPPGAIVTQKVVTASLDSTGSFAVTLTSSWDDGWMIEPPGAMPYRITLQVDGLNDNYTALIPPEPGQTEVWLHDLIALDAPPNVVLISGGPPSGPAGGDLTGTYPGPTLAVDRVRLSGDTMTGTLHVGAGTGPTAEVWVESSFDGGEDDGQAGHFDSTGRVNLESYQRASYRSFGEVLRIYSRRADSKQMIAWYGPHSYDANRDPVGNDYPWFWMGAHYEANDHGSIHGHWSCEIPDTSGALQTRLELPIWNPVTGVYGMDKGVIKTNATDFNIRTSNGQELRLSSPAGNVKPITFSLDSDGRTSYRRWQVRVTGDAESGGNAGSNFQVARYDDTGVLVDSPIAVDRATGGVSIGGTSGTAGGLLVTRASGIAVQLISTAAGGTVLATTGADAVSRAFQASVSGDATPRFATWTDGKLEWGPGNAARDTTLYRSSAGVLRTDTSLHVGVNLRMNTTSLGGGSGVVALANATTAPSTNPTGGGVLYAEGGALKWRGSTGTVTVIAPA